jgi:hypothetical protein
MAVTINASTSTGLVQTADTSGEIELQSNGTTALKVNTNEGIQILNCLGVGNATPSTSGAGITFPATQSASSDANTLDDYEEGTWTPVVKGTSTVGTATYTTQNARYTKIGRMVFIEFYLVWNSGNGTGNIFIDGLPFTSSNSGTFPSLAIGYWDNIAITSGNVPMAYVNSSGTRIELIAMTAGGGVYASVSYDAAGALQLSGCYTV